MRIFAALLGGAFVLGVLWDSFETIVLPRRVTRLFRLTRLFYRATWIPWRWAARRMASGKRREGYLSFYGPLSLLVLVAVWAVNLILGFAFLHWGLGTRLNLPVGTAALTTYLYFSGVNFFTLGLGDVTALDLLGRVLVVAESGMGFGFLALVIGYLPVIYQAFSRRETAISLLDARAGSPPTAAELLRRHGAGRHMEELERLLQDWERWSAEVMESHLSYPVLAYYRSQHNNQSWIAALTTILDTSALLLSSVDGAPERQALLTFAMARHAVVDLAQVFYAPPRPPASDRLPRGEEARLREIVAAAGFRLRDGAGTGQKLAELRRLYEPYVNALGEYLMMTLPPWVVSKRVADNWQTSAWERISSGTLEPAKPCSHPDEEHS